MQTAASNPADTLAHHLKKIFSGNFVRDDQITEMSRKIERYAVELRITWKFEVIRPEKKYKGNPGVDSYHHFGRNIKQYQNSIAQTYSEGTNNIAYRTRFLGDMIKLETKGLIHANIDRFEVQHLGGLSVHEGCSPCKETGQVKCGQCSGGGTLRCGHCRGTGTEYVYQTVSYTDSRGETQYRNENVGRMCFNCHLGRVRCDSCSGKGKVACKACDANGFITKVTQLALHAIPEFTVRVQEGVNKGLLSEYLHTVKCEDFKRRMSYQATRSSRAAHSLSSGTIIYSFDATVTQLDLEIKQQPFTFHALGRKDLNLMSRPYVFDFLFENIFVEWNEMNGGSNKKILDPTKAKGLFDKLRTASVPKQALEILCQGEKPAELADKIKTTVCYNLISDTAASSLIAIQQRILNVLSPRYSEGSWTGAMALPWLALFIATHAIVFDVKGIELLFPQAIFFVIGLLLTLIAGVIVHPLSVLSSRRIQQSIPEQFRRPTAFKEPLRRYLKLTMGVFLAGFITGLIFLYFGIDAIPELLIWLFGTE